MPLVNLASFDSEGDSLKLLAAPFQCPNDSLSEPGTTNYLPGFYLRPDSSLHFSWVDGKIYVNGYIPLALAKEIFDHYLQEELAENWLGEFTESPYLTYLPQLGINDVTLYELAQSLKLPTDQPDWQTRAIKSLLESQPVELTDDYFYLDSSIIYSLEGFRYFVETAKAYYEGKSKSKA